MDTNEQRLIVSLEARMTKYEKDMTRARMSTNDNFKKMEGRARQSAQNMEKTLGSASTSIAGKLEGMFAPLLRGGAVTAAVGGTVMAVKEMASSIAEVDREARKAGVTSKVWQQWTQVAVGTGMSIDGVTDALKELNIRGDEFAKTGKGSAQEAFTRLGYSATDVAQKLKDPSRFIDEIIGKLQKLDSAAQTRILDEVFGGTGAEQMAKVLGMSVTEIQKMRSEAALFTTEQIEAAKKIDAEFSTMWRNFTVYAKQAAIEGVGVAGKIIGALRGDFLPGYDEAKGNVARLSSSEAQLKRLQAQRQSIVDQISNVKAEPFNVLQESELRTLEATLKALDEQIHEATGGSDEFKQSLKELSDMTTRLDSGFEKNVASTANFKSALVELKNLVPELKAELDTLATTGRYQITGATLEGLMKELGLSGDRLYDENTQDELGRALALRRGNNPDELRKEWTGLRNVDDATIRNTYANTPMAAQPLAPTTGQQQAIDLAKQQDEARKSLNRTVQEGLDLARFEQSISGMSANQQRVELQLYQAQAEAKRNGITLSDTEIAKMREKITMTEGIKGKTQEAADSAEGLRNAQEYFAESFTSSLSGLLTGTQTLQGALRGLLNSLVDATLQAALLGKGPLSGLFGGMGGGIFGKLFGLGGGAFPPAPVGLYDRGGYTGDGGKLEPAGVVHRGEYVMSKAATARIGVGNLEAMHRGALRGSFDTGGYAGNAPAIRRPDLKAAER
ncbi:phage tail tape measure protein [Rhizobium sp. PL01]|uniref:phage tail tape measure protein n=1 Tax=Rhizobium sp. PL01 TaxID=3085631 RepID=UPI002981B404|nr:phage tail tape measure protein [Rhizobium sp. PL01]MDW5314091.1 phage tail tape measure protein [Rhizobium sp. PL01]